MTPTTMDSIKVSATDVKLKPVFHHPKGYPLEEDLFLQAVRAGKHRLVSQILKVNSELDVDHVDSQGRTALLIAVQHENYEIRNNLVKLLLKYGADVNITDNSGMSALMYACQSKAKVDTIRSLIKQAGCSINLKDKNGSTALNWAASVDNWRAIRIIVHSKFTKNDVNLWNKDKQGLSPIEIAIDEDFTETCRVLLYEGNVDTLKLSAHYKAKLELLSRHFPEIYSDNDFNNNEVIDIESTQLCRTELNPIAMSGFTPPVAPMLTPIDGDISYPRKLPKLPAISNPNKNSKNS